ncbi:MAG: hypothetical protein RIA72_05380 [Sphingopyxis sp.]|uniref:glycosyltransferase family 2 protein n=1 Tax=Sphingopyxis sp. TaxID=1908224 RepID=UPI0032EE4B2E
MMTAADPALADCRLMVATPIYDGAQGSYVRAALALVFAAQAKGVPVRFEFILHEAQIHRARSLLADLFVQSDCTHLLFVDADIDFAAADIFSMVEAMAARPDCSILGAAVPRRTINWPQVARAAEAGLGRDNPVDLARFTGDFALSFLRPDERFALTDLVELSQLGTGLMLIRRDVVETLRARHPELAFRTDARDRQGTGVRETVHALFLPEIDRASGLMLSEDYAFCRRARDAGFRIWFAPWVRTTHSGPATFRGSLADLAPLFTSSSVS